MPCSAAEIHAQSRRVAVLEPNRNSAGLIATGRKTALLRHSGTRQRVQGLRQAQRLQHLYTTRDQTAADPPAVTAPSESEPMPTTADAAPCGGSGSVGLAPTDRRGGRPAGRPGDMTGRHAALGLMPHKLLMVVNPGLVV